MTPARPLLLTRDPVLEDSVRRLAVVAGADPEVVGVAAAGRRSWASAGAVVVGADLLEEAASAGLDRRAGVVVVARGDDGPAWPAALALGAEQVLVLPGDERSMLAWFARAAAGQRERARTIGVLGGSGGAGASVLAVAVALALARRSADVVLVDTDPGSCGIDLLLGAEDEPGARWCDLAAVTSRVAPEALRSALPLVHGLHLLSVDRDSDAPLPEAAVAAVVDSARAGFAAVVLDLPRSRPDLLDVLVPRCDEVLLVATADVRGASAARRALTALGARVPVRLVLRRRRRSSLDPDQLADWLGAPVAAEVLDDDGLTAAIDRGEPPGPRSRLSRVCDDLAESLLAVS